MRDAHPPPSDRDCRDLPAASRNPSGGDQPQITVRFHHHVLPTIGSP